MNDYCTPDEKYQRDFVSGYRIGRICATRKILIKLIKIKGNPSKKIIQKIKLETDLTFLHLVLRYTLEQNTSINDIEASYDELTRSEQEFIDEKYCTYVKSNSTDANK
jgi:hypothetical protein